MVNINTIGLDSDGFKSILNYPQSLNPRDQNTDFFKIVLKLMIHFIMSMVIMAFSVIIAILSLCILTKNQNLHNLNEIVLANIKNLQSQRAPENFKAITDDFENGVEIIDAKISNATDDTEEFEYPSTYYSGKSLYFENSTEKIPLRSSRTHQSLRSVPSVS